MFGEATETLLRANLNRTVFPTWEKTERCTAEELLSMRRKVPKLRPFKFHNFQNAVYNITKGHMAHLKTNFEQQANLKSEILHDPPDGKRISGDMVTHTHIKHFNKEHPTWVAVRLDKNAACYAIVCFRFFLSVAYNIFTTSPNYRLFKDCRDER